jgi:hypothetical protein
MPTNQLLESIPLIPIGFIPLILKYPIGCEPELILFSIVAVSIVPKLNLQPSSHPYFTRGTLTLFRRGWQELISQQD